MERKRRCYHCSSMIPAELTICPYCKRDLLKSVTKSQSKAASQLFRKLAKPRSRTAANLQKRSGIAKSQSNRQLVGRIVTETAPEKPVAFYLGDFILGMTGAFLMVTGFFISSVAGFWFSLPVIFVMLGYTLILFRVLTGLIGPLEHRWKIIKGIICGFLLVGFLLGGWPLLVWALGGN